MQITIERTAGQCVSDWNLDRAYETETAAMLEKVMCTDDDFPASSIADYLKNADYHIGQAVVILARVADLAEGWHKEKNLDDLLERLEDFRIDMKGERVKLCGDR